MLLVLVAVSHVVGEVGRTSHADLLRETLAAHAATVARLRTVSFQFSTTSNHTGSVTQQDGEYLRSGDDQRVYIRQDGARFEEYVSNERIVDTTQQTLHPTGKVLHTGGIRPNAGYYSSPALPHPWGCTLIGFNTKRGVAAQPLDELIQDYLVNPSARLEAGLVAVTAENEGITIRLDPNHGYLVHSLDTKGPSVSGDPSSHVAVSRQRITSFQEVAPGVYFPSGYTSESQVDGQPMIRQTATFTAVAVNQIVDVGAFRPRFAHGTQVRDLIRGTEYLADVNGKPIGPEKSYTVVGVGPNNPNAADVAVVGPTTGEERRGGWWLLPAGLSVLLAGLAIGFWRRGR